MRSSIEQGSKAGAVLLVCALLAGLLFLAGSSGCSKKWKAIPSPLTLYFTCDTNGRYEPCGCFSGQHGGLTRLKTHLDAEAPSNAIRVDVGNAIEGTADYQVLKYRYIQEAFGRMNYSALNIGEREAALSKETLASLKQNSTAPMVSANVVDESTGERIFEPWTIINHLGYRIAFIGALQPPVESDGLGEGVAVEPMQPALAKILPELKEKADLLVLLAFADEATLSELARQFHEFDIILGGKVKQPSQVLLKENRSVILFTTNESKTVGVLRGEVVDRSNFVPSGFDIVFLHEDIPQDRAFAARVDDYRNEVRHATLEIDKVAHTVSHDTVPGIAPAASYVGTEKCASCHVEAHKTWERTGHAHAFAALVSKGSDADPSCIACHTVGFGTASGYRREYAGKQMANVGCESCHGPGSLHVEQRQPGRKVYFKYRPLGAADCASCHHGEFSRPFNWDEFWPRIKHGKEPPVSVQVTAQ